MSKSFPNRFLILTIFWKHGRVVLQLIANQSVLNRPGRFDSYCFRKIFVISSNEGVTYTQVSLGVVVGWVPTDVSKAFKERNFVTV